VRRLIGVDAEPILQLCVFVACLVCCKYLQLCTCLIASCAPAWLTDSEVYVLILVAVFPIEFLVCFCCVLKTVPDDWSQFWLSGLRQIVWDIWDNETRALVPSCSVNIFCKDSEVTQLVIRGVTVLIDEKASSGRWKLWVLVPTASVPFKGRKCAVPPD